MRYDEGGNRLRIARLSDRGVKIWGAETVYIADDVKLDNIEEGAEIYNATLSGESLRIGRGSQIGVSGPARIDDCQIGRNCEVGAGTYQNATLLDGATVRGFAELRPGTLLEEDVEAGHSVAFKNTILTATCVAGSLINFCDVFMSGGTSREDHSEIGSGAVHFNFDPRGDKWGSLIGDVQGVLMRSAPIFVGGQVGLAGPLHVGFGSVIAAGSVVRRDVGPDCVHHEAAEPGTKTGFDRQVYAGLNRKFRSTAKLIGNLWAFAAWYDHVRLPFAEDRQRPLYEAALEQARRHIRERVARLEKLIAKLERSIEKSSGSSDEGLKAFHAEHRRLIDGAEEIRRSLLAEPEVGALPSTFVRGYEEQRDHLDHVAAVRAMSDDAAAAGAAWLTEIATQPVTRLQSILAG